ncbi:MAG: transglycosylase domain-containing protein [Acidimicrobiales bacterium]|nr:transglycosylase domain-containing protein [Acidimicrobiales bacterium]
MSQSSNAVQDVPEGMRLNRRGKLKKLRKRSIIWRWRRVFYLALLLVVAGSAGAFWVLSQVKLPAANDQLRQTTFVCFAQTTENCGPENADFKLKGDEDRVNIVYEDLPDVVIEAVISAEDRDFFQHGGIDPVGIARAVMANANEEEITQGGSTITQQYVKNVYLTRERSITRKLREAILAVRVDDELSKEEILERYLNTIYFGRGAYGIQAASRAYFRHDIQELDGLDNTTGEFSPIELAQVAYLAGLIRAPESADAQRNPNVATQRRNSVLNAMFEEGYITRDEAKAAKQEGWEVDDLFASRNIVSRTPATTLGTVRDWEHGTEYFAEYVRQKLVEEFGEDQVYGGGLRVYTTLSMDMQQAAYDTVTETLNLPGDPAASIVALDDRGRVRAMMGGTDFANQSVNLAVGVEGGGSGRQPGSSFKPFAVATALKEGYAADARMTVPSAGEFDLSEYGAGGGTWRVSGGGGSHSMMTALPASSNMFFATLMLKLGSERVIETANQMGVTADLPTVPSIVLGAGEVSPLDMASAYSTLMNHGTHYEPQVITRVEDSDGNVIWTAPEEGQQVLTPEVADITTTAMRSVVTSGTGRAAALDNVAAAGKTGTTQNNKDAWFVGFRCNFVASVWMGYPGFDGAPVTPMNNVHGERQEGGRFPARMWHDFMTRADPFLNDNCDLASVSDFPEGKDYNDEGELPGGAVAGGNTAVTAPPTPATVTVPPVTSPPTTQPPVTVTVTVPPTTVVAPGGANAGEGDADDEGRRSGGSP